MNGTPWQEAVFRHSLMKKEKVRLISRRVVFTGQRVLDLGVAQGTVSRQLQKCGGRWIHADSDWQNVRECRDLFPGCVVQVDGRRLPFGPDSFDRVLLLDFLEHMTDDAAVLGEVRRVLRKDGRIVISTPISGKSFILNKLKNRVGLTPETYGHVREGYSLGRLRELLADSGFETETATTYAKFFVELFEIILNLVYARKRRPDALRQRRSGQIAPASAAEWEQDSFLFNLYRRVFYPLVFLFSRLDVLLPFKTGYATLVIGRKK